MSIISYHSRIQTFATSPPPPQAISYMCCVHEEIDGDFWLTMASKMPNHVARLAAICTKLNVENATCQ